MTSNVIINFGANASQAFKAMHAVKAEMKTVQAQAAATTGAMSGGGFGSYALGKVGKKLEKGYWKGLTGMVSGLIGYHVVAEILAPVKDGFKEVADKSIEFKGAIALVKEGLESIGKSIAHSVMPAFEKIPDGVQWLFGKIHGPLAGALFRAGYEDSKEQGLFGSQFTSPMSEHEKWQSDQKAIAKAQLHYIKETATTLHRMENDLERMNTVDPW